MVASSLHTTNLPSEIVAAMQPAPELAIRHYQRGVWCVVEVDGELDIQAVALMRRHLAGDPNHLVFDLTCVTFMDASMLGVLTSSWRLATRAGGSVRLAGPSRQVRRLLGITRLDQVVPVYTTLEDALAPPLG